MKEVFLKNYDKLLQIVESKEDVNETSYAYIYSMVTKINYKKLKEKLILIKDNL